LASAVAIRPEPINPIVGVNFDKLTLFLLAVLVWGAVHGTRS
jgi:hypothetical protein